MSFNDPLSDMIARIKNAAERKRSKVSTPASKLRGRVLEVLQKPAIRHRERNSVFRIGRPRPMPVQARGSG